VSRSKHLLACGGRPRTFAPWAPPWQDPAFQRSAQAWIDGELDKLSLARTGEIEQPHAVVWSTAMRVPTEIGDVRFKANMDQLRHEAAVAELLSTRQPELVPPLLARDPQTGWMLMRDAGAKLRDVVPRERSLDRWLRSCGERSDHRTELKPRSGLDRSSRPPAGSGR
jgi:hypothetical protein